MCLCLLGTFENDSLVAASTQLTVARRPCTPYRPRRPRPMLAGPPRAFSRLLAKQALLCTWAHLASQIRPIADALADSVFSWEVPPTDSGAEHEGADTINAFLPL